MGTIEGFGEYAVLIMFLVGSVIGAFLVGMAYQDLRSDRRGDGDK